MASQTLRTLKLSLLADVSEFGANLDKAGSSFRGFTRGVEQASKIATAVIGTLGGIAISSIEAASDLQETSAAIEAVFGRDSARKLQDFARNAARSLGQSRQQALEAAQTFGVFGQSAGLSGDELVNFSTELITLATDLAAFNNTSVDQAIVALGAALRGESEPIRNYGVLLDAATLKNRALADGLIETTTDALAPATRVLAAYSEILAQTGTQQGTFALESDGLAAQQKTLTSEFANFRVEIGEELLPYVQQLLPEITALFDEIFSADPKEIVAIATSIGDLAVKIVALNAALKGFAAVQSAAKFLFSTGGALLLALSAGGSAEVEPLSVQRERREAAAQLELQGGVPTPGLRRGRNPQTGIGRTAASQPIIVNGVVGSPYQVFREIERAQQLGTRSGIGSSAQVR